VPPFWQWVPDRWDRRLPDSEETVMSTRAEANLSALIESTEDHIWSVDLNDRLILFNRAFQRHIEQTYGIRAEVGMHPADLFLPERAALWPQLFKRALAEGAFRIEYPLLNGHTLEMALNPIVEDGEATGVSVFGKDITERKNSESALRDAEKKFRAIFDGALEGMFQTTFEGRFLNANPALARMLGYDSPEEATSTITDAAHILWADPEERARFMQLLSECGVVRGFECQLKRKDGTELWVSLNCRMTLGADGKALINEGFVEDITERRRAATALAESETRFRRFFEENGSVMLLLEPASGEIAGANRAAANYYGYAQEQLVGMNISQLNTLPPEEIARERQRTLHEERSYFNFRHRLASGEVRDVEVYASPIDADGRTLLFSIVHDVAERKRTEEALRESLESLKEAQTAGALGSYVLDVLAGMWTSSEVLDGIFGIDKEYDRTVGGWTALIHSDDRAMMAAYFADEVVGQGKPFDKEYRIVRQTDRAERWVHGMGRLEFDAHGRPLKMHGVIRDITGRKQSEMQLRESEERYRSTFEQAAVGIVHASFEGSFLRCNPRFAEIVGYLQEEIPGMAFHQIMLPEDLPEIEAERQRIASGTASNTTWEKRYLRKDGTLTWVRVTVSAQRDALGRALHAIALFEDINARKAAEERLAAITEALRASELQYRTVFQTSVDGICISRMSDGRYIDVNKAFLDLMGFEREEVVGRTSLELNIWTEPGVRDHLVELLRRNSSFRDTETQFIRKDGKKLRLLLSGSAIEIEGVPCILSVVRDISAAKAAEERLAASQQALHDSEERYRSTFEQAAVGMLHTSLDGRILRCNARFAEIIGYPHNEIAGITFQQITAPEDLDKSNGVLKRMTAAAVDATGPSVWEKRYLRKDGSRTWVKMTVSIQRDADGTPLHYITVVEDINARKAAEESLTSASEALRTSEERYRTIFQMSINAVTINRVSDDAYVEVNQEFCDITGYDRQEIIGRTPLEIGIWANPQDQMNLVKELSLNPVCPKLEAQFRKKDGTVIWGLMAASLIELNGVPCVLCVTQDISAAKAAEGRLTAATEALRVSEERYRTAFQTSLDAININRLDDGKYIECNMAFLKIMGYEREEVIGMTSTELAIWADPRDRNNLAAMLHQNLSCRDFEARFRKKNGEVFWGLMSASVFELDGVPCILSMTRDISDAKAAEDKIRNLAFYDSLTSLPNRRLLLERLRQTLADSAPDRRMQALFHVDLDKFKTLNETLGHQTGDLLLQEAALRLTSCIGEDGTVARLGGDEFLVMLEKRSATAEGAAALATELGAKMLVTLSQPYLLAGHACRSTASIGVAVFGDSPDTADEVLQQADIALDQAKTAGRNTLRFFAPALQAAVNARATLENDLRKAIRTNQFVLYYQPQVDRNRLIGAEALIRWNHPKRGLLAPGEFIPIAEETGLILPLGEWVLETACAQVAVFAKQPSTAHVAIAVNISARQFRQPDFVQQVLAVLDRTGADPRNIELELTESMLVKDIEDVIAKMTELKSHGLRFSLDDFGTGYSSLAYLRRLPLDLLKIDRSFVRDILVDAGSGAIAQTVLSLSRAMGLPVIAEGVETEEQRDFLTGLGCHSFQGYLFSRPLPLDEFQRVWLNSAESAQAIVF